MEGKVEHGQGVVPTIQIVVQSASNGSMTTYMSASLIVEQSMVKNFKL